MTRNHAPSAGLTLLATAVVLVAAVARDGRIATPDGRIELELIVRDNGLVDGLRLTQRH